MTSLNWCQPQHFTERLVGLWMAQASVNPADAMWKPNAATLFFFHSSLPPPFFLFSYSGVFTIENWHFFLYVYTTPLVRLFPWIHQPIKGYSIMHYRVGEREKVPHWSLANKSLAIRWRFSQQLLFTSDIAPLLNVYRVLNKQTKLTRHRSLFRIFFFFLRDASRFGTQETETFLL